MNDSSNLNALHWVLGAALVVITIFVAIALIGTDSQADNINSSAGVANTNPSVDTIYFNTGAGTFRLSSNEEDGVVSLTAGEDTEFHISGTVSDANGDSDINTVQATFWSPESINELCSTDVNNCFRMNTCSTQNNDSDSLNYDCSVNLGYWTNSTRTGGLESDGDWTATVTVTDQQGSAVSQTATIDIDTLLALDFPSTIDWGTMAQGARTTLANNVELDISQRGNDAADIDIYGSDMTCSNTGTIPATNIKWSTADLGFTAITDPDRVLTTNAESPKRADINIGYRLDTIISKKLYWNIEIPEYDVSGTCTGTTTLIAVPSS